jgi:FkbM family methyltransferase
VMRQPPAGGTKSDAGDFRCFDNWVSRWISERILAGNTYPALPEIGDVHTVLDVGANCGSAAVYFARCYPHAVVHAVEPGSAAFDLLTRNAARYPNIRVHNVGLYSSDELVPLYEGGDDASTRSIFRREGKNTDTSEMVQLRCAATWLTEHGIERIDLLKVDAEGCEPEILESLWDVLAFVKVIYVEYDSVQARRHIDRLLDPSHELCHGMLFLDQGEMIYVSRHVLDSDETAQAAIIEFFRDRLAKARTSQ